MKPDEKIKRSNEDAFSRMELKNLLLITNLYDDSDNEKDRMKIIFKLDTIILDDTRKDSLTPRSNRLIERYNLKQEASKQMINVSYEKKLSLIEEDDENMVFVPEQISNFIYFAC